MDPNKPTTFTTRAISHADGIEQKVIFRARVISHTIGIEQLQNTSSRIREISHALGIEQMLIFSDSAISQHHRNQTGTVNIIPRQAGQLLTESNKYTSFPANS